MWKSAIVVVGIFAILLVASAQKDGSSDESARFEEGRAIYDAMCYQCHGDEGGGLLGSFPGLDGNDNVQALPLIVNNVARGRERMPAYPLLDASQIAAVATYIRTAWENDFGAVDAAEVEEVLANIGVEIDATPVSIWDGVYTDEQAERGRGTFVGQCSQCHGTRGDGREGVDPDQQAAPSLVKADLFGDWGGAPVAVWHLFASETMPLINPGGLDPQEYVDAFTYVLQLSEVPAGDEELVADPELLGTVVIEREDEESGE